MSNGLERLKSALQSKGLVETAAQIAGAAIVGGPAGAATAVLGKIAGAVGAPPAASVEDLASAVRSASPEQAAVLAEIEREQTRRLEITADSAKDARAKFGMDKGILSLGAAVLAINTLVMIGLFVVPIPEPNQDVAYLLAGNFMGAFNAVVFFFFGSSSGSSDKAKTIDAMLRR